MLFFLLFFTAKNTYSQNNQIDSKKKLDISQYKKRPEDLSKTGIYVLRLSDGSEKVTRDPIILYKRDVIKISEFNRAAFFEKYKNIKGSSIVVLELKVSVKKLLSSIDLFSIFNIKAEDRNLPIVISNFKSYAKDKNSLYATPGAIKSMYPNYKEGVIIIEMNPDEN